MNSIPLNPELQNELEHFAREHGQTPAAALQDAVAAYLEWQRRDVEEAVEGIREGFAGVKAGRTRPASEWFSDMLRKHELPD
ncbi:MAG: hypothetical protein H7039_15065 [Bryobacteraceae bacterium]|nr:hypothetical protein [Bryobacteraceae bacterium]